MAKNQFSIWYIVAAILLSLAFQQWYATWRSVEPIPYSQFRELLDADKITDLQITPDTISGTLTEALPDGRTAFTTNRVDPALADELAATGVAFTGVVDNRIFPIVLSWVLPLALFYVIWSFAAKRMVSQPGLGGLMGIGKSKAKVYVESDIKVTFDDVAGVDEAKDEMGHALVAASLPGIDPVHKVSIIPRGVGALGYTIQRPTEDRFLHTTSDLENRMAVLMGGRAAEKLVFDEISTGASDDLAKITDIARLMVSRFGMSDAVGQIVYEEERQAFMGDIYGTTHPATYSPATADQIDSAMRALVERAFQRALDILKTRRTDLDAGATLLLQRETLTAHDFPAMSSRHPSITLPAAEFVDQNADGLNTFSDAMWEGWPAPTNADQYVLRSGSEESGPHIRMLADLGLDRDEIVAYTGFSGSHVQNAMSQDHAEIEWTSGICRALHQSKDSSRVVKTLALPLRLTHPE